MGRKIFAIFSIMVSMLCINVRAIEISDVEQLVAKEEKYYKTISTNSNSSLMSLNSSNNLNSFTIEVSKDEYDEFIPSYSTQSNTTETTYKKMTTSIYKSGSKYRYQVELNWKNIPKTRSYDIIGIGFLSSVKASSISFTNNYCTSKSECTQNSNARYTYTSNNGVGVVFELKQGNVISMSQKLSIDISKNTSSKITKQVAYGDYSHATSNISLTNAEKYAVNTQGIMLNNDIKNYYDEIKTADATWTGSW